MVAEQAAEVGTEREFWSGLGVLSVDIAVLLELLLGFEGGVAQSALYLEGRGLQFGCGRFLLEEGLVTRRGQVHGLTLQVVGVELGLVVELRLLLARNCDPACSTHYPFHYF